MLSQTSNVVQEKVFLRVAKIPKGQVMTYKGVARAIGHPRAARAVGSALNSNRYPFYGSANKGKRIPCHRVIRSDRNVGGYSGPNGTKERLLKQEGIKIVAGRVTINYLHNL